ncbi:MAG: (d)CMP kinase [Oscillospiraceae bacterium]|jgi:cytidylate kinase|nr:(d)CMP kinase [Oscillospiraceae bacterium]
MGISVAIDGPSGAGKSSLSRLAAKALDFIYIDTGALYRTVGIAASRAGMTTNSLEKMPQLLKKMQVQMFLNDKKEQVILLDGEDVSSQIRTPIAAMMGSAVSALPPVRAYLLDFQRNMAKSNNVIMDGRDIGTVVLPNADVKVFLTAAAEQRAKRRWLEHKEKGLDVKLEDVLAEVNQRDYNDTHRVIAPLKQADDAVLLDTTNLDFEASLEALLNIIKAKL